MHYALKELHYELKTEICCRTYNYIGTFASDGCMRCK